MGRLCDSGFDLEVLSAPAKFLGGTNRTGVIVVETELLSCCESRAVDSPTSLYRPAFPVVQHQ